MRGVNFDMIPGDAIGVYSGNNQEPLGWLNNPNDWAFFDILSKTDNEMELRAKSISSHGGASYLGAIVSADKETIYWINNTRPLP